ncbi:MAG TPA: 2'-5' RNA ligase family protein [Gaiellaceae bacterium]|nr:2'-5' RNA ligase family protein [Gaiellaceae bacterium]
MSRPLETALVLVLDDAGPFDAVRRKFAAWSVARGIPFHITLLWPFAPADELTEELFGDVRSLFAAQAAFGFALTRVAMWPRDVYAVPEPEGALRACMGALHARFPQWPPYGGIHADVVPHATLGEDINAESVYSEIERRVAPHLPARYKAERATLLEEFERDCWRERESFPLGSQGP